MVGHLADIITYAKFQDDIFKGYDFTGGRISHFPIDFCMDLTTVQRDCAACDDGFIGCRDIRENSLHWLMLEVLPNKWFLGYKWGVAVDTRNEVIGVLWRIERQATFYGLLCTSSQGTKKINKNVRDVATSPLPPPYTPISACLNFRLWSRVLD